MPAWSKKLGVATVTIFFAVMWGLHIRSQVTLPGGEGGSLDYSRLLGPGQTEVNRSYGIYFFGSRLGATDTHIEEEADGTIRVQNITNLKPGSGIERVLNVSVDVTIEFSARASPLSGIKHFSLFSQELGVMLNGRPSDDGFRVTGRFRGDNVNMTVPVSERRFIGGLLSPMAGLPELSAETVGRTWQITMVNPLEGSVQNVQVKVQHRRSVSVDSEEWAIYRLELSAGGKTWQSWVRENGELLIQGTPFGLTLRQEDLPEAVLEATRTE